MLFLPEAAVIWGGFVVASHDARQALREAIGTCASLDNCSTFIRNNAIMSSRSQRVSNGIDSLVRQLLVEIPGEDPASLEERECNAVDFVREVLGR